MRPSLAGYVDLTEDVDLAAAGRGELRRRLVPAAASSVDRRFLVFGGVAVLLLGLTAWAVRRPPASVSAPAPTPGRSRAFDHSAPTPPRPTPTGMGSPGVHRGADGLEYFGDFHLVEPLGRGGMASVYRVERGGEVYALKRPLPAFLEEPEFLERGAVEGVPFFTSAARPGVPAELDRIVLRLLSKAPELRYAAAEELVLDLRDFLNRAA